MYSALTWASWELDKDATLFNFKPEMFEVTNYESADPIKIGVIP